MGQSDTESNHSVNKSLTGREERRTPGGCTSTAQAMKKVWWLVSIMLVIIFAVGLLVGISVGQNKNTDQTASSSASRSKAINFTDKIQKDIIVYNIIAEESKCSDNKCRHCTDDIIPASVNPYECGPNTTKNVKNESCYLCNTSCSTTCKTYEDLLNATNNDGYIRCDNNLNCNQEKITCCAWSKMRDLNNACGKDKTAVCVTGPSGDEISTCRCLRGKLGDTCQDEQQKVNCTCFKSMVEIFHRDDHHHYRCDDTNKSTKWTTCDKNITAADGQFNNCICYNGSVNDSLPSCSSSEGPPKSEKSTGSSGSLPVLDHLTALFVVLVYVVMLKRSNY